MSKYIHTCTLEQDHFDWIYLKIYLLFVLSFFFLFWIIVSIASIAMSLNKNKKFNDYFTSHNLSAHKWNTYVK